MNVAWIDYRSETDAEQIVILVTTGNELSK